MMVFYILRRTKMQEPSAERDHLTGGEASRRRFLRALGGVGIGTVASVESIGTATAEGGDLIWEFETGQQVDSSPTIVDGTLFVGTRDPGTANNGYVYALDASDGTEQWVFETGRYIDSSPTVAEGTLFVVSDFDVYALDAAMGDQQWEFDAAQSVGCATVYSNCRARR